jgi:hypothetical protein
VTGERKDDHDLHVVSVSLGSPSRDSWIETELLGRRILFERRGTRGGIDAAGDMVAELDGHVDAIGLGGIDLFVQAAGRRYPLGDAQRIAARASRTPVVCGAGLKDTLERRVVEQLDASIGWAGRRVLMLAAVDRFGMAEALARHGADLRMGDLAFALGIPIQVRSLGTVAALARVIGPTLRFLPFSWLYPTGDKQDAGESGWRERYFRNVDVIAGDFLFLKRYAPPDLAGAIVLTNTTTPEDVEMLRARGVRTLITTTPRFDGRSLSTNLLEAGLVALAGRHPLDRRAYGDLIERIGLGPTVVHLNDDPSPPA